MIISTCLKYLLIAYTSFLLDRTPPAPASLHADGEAPEAVHAAREEGYLVVELAHLGPAAADDRVGLEGREVQLRARGEERLPGRFTFSPEEASSYQSKLREI